MPIKPLCTWVAAQKRWTKWHKGTTYSVSCKQLGMPATKEQSVLAANLWWEAKLAQIQADERANAPKPDPKTELIKSILSGFSVSELYEVIRKGKAAEDLVQILDRTANVDVPPPANGSAVGLVALPDTAVNQLENGAVIPSSIIDDVELNGNVGDLNAIVRTLDVVPIPSGKTIRHQAEHWLDILKSSVRVGQMSIGRWEAYQRNIAYFLDWDRTGNKLFTCIDAHLFERFWSYLGVCMAETRFSAATANGILMTVRQFIKRLAEMGLIALPGNIGSKRLRISVPAQKIDVFTLDEVKSLLAVCTDRTKLYAYLCLNCGMYQSDISDIKPSEVDLSAGTLTRSRSKLAGRFANVPVVKYYLWPETVELLRKFGKRTGERYLTSETGQPLVNRRFVGDKVKKSDSINSAFVRVFAGLKFKKPIKSLRKTSASLLESHPVYGRYVTYFLGNSPESVTDRHYAAPSDSIFRDACQWLRLQYLPDTAKSL